MHFNDNVDKAVVDAILESSLWNKAHIEVQPRKLTENSDEAEQNMFDEGHEIETIPEFEGGIANKYAEPATIEGEEDISFSLDDLQLVLDNLTDEDLMEHALTMLDVFDVAYDTINEGDDDEDEEEEEEEAEAEAAE